MRPFVKVREGAFDLSVSDVRFTPLQNPPPTVNSQNQKKTHAQEDNYIHLTNYELFSLLVFTSISHAQNFLFF